MMHKQTMSQLVRDARPKPPAVLVHLERHAQIAHMAAVEAANRARLRRVMTADAAYFRALRRGFEPGHELEDWLAAEIEVANAQRLTVLSPSEDTGCPRND